MDWNAIAKKVMDGYDSTTAKAFAAKRAAKAQPEEEVKPTDGTESPAEEASEGPPHSEPDGDELDESTKAKLMALLQED